MMNFYIVFSHHLIEPDQVDAGIQYDACLHGRSWIIKQSVVYKGRVPLAESILTCKHRECVIYGRHFEKFVRKASSPEPVPTFDI